MMLKRTMVMVAAFAAAIATSVTTASIASADQAIAGTFNAITPTRVLDTRSGIGAPKMTVAPRATLTFNAVAGFTGTAKSVALTITAVGPTSTGWLTVFPTGATQPLASTLNFTPGRTTPNSTIVDVGTNGNVSVYNGSPGTVDILGDITGWWTAGTVDPTTAGALTSQTPVRILDTRNGTHVPAAALSNTVVPVAGHAGVPATGVSAVAANLTVTESSASGYLSAGSELAQPDSRTSSLNFQTKTSRANLVLVPLNPNGTISIFNGSFGTAHIVIDILGYFNTGTPSAGGAFISSTPFRVIDTRVVGGSVPALSITKLQVLPNDGTASVFSALTVTVTAVNPQAAGFFTVWDGTTQLPQTSNSNFQVLQNVAATTVLPINPDGTVSFYNGSYGHTDIVVDIDGFLLANPSLTLKANAAKAKAAGGANATTVRDAIARTRAFAAAHS